MDLVKLRTLLGLDKDAEETLVTATATASRIALGLALDSDEDALEAAIKAAADTRTKGSVDDDDKGDKGDDADETVVTATAVATSASLGIPLDSDADAITTAIEAAGADDDQDKADKGDDEDETAKLRREVDELKAANVTATVTAVVDNAIRARKFSPASRASLVAMAAATPDEFTKLAKITPDGTIGASAERGTSDDDTPDELLDEYALDDDDAAMARQLGNDPDEVLAQRIQAAGKTVPPDLLKKIETIHADEIKARASV